MPTLIVRTRSLRRRKKKGKTPKHMSSYASNSEPSIRRPHRWAPQRKKKSPPHSLNYPGLPKGRALKMPPRLIGYVLIRLCGAPRSRLRECPACLSLGDRRTSPSVANTVVRACVRKQDKVRKEREKGARGERIGVFA